MSGLELRTLVLGGTAWLGRELSSQAIERGHAVTCLARGESGEAARGADLIRADRATAGAYDEVRDAGWDVVIELSWQPSMVREALAALRDRARYWVYVSSCSVYASHVTLGADEDAELLPATDRAEASIEVYGEAKVACELAARAHGEDDLLTVRSGLIGGPGDGSDRAGYWVARAACDRLGAMLAPDSPEATTQVVDVRDLAGWILDCAEQGLAGTYDAVGPAMKLDEWIETSRLIGGHTGPVVRAAPDWLLARGVDEFMGASSLPLWIAEPAMRGFCARAGTRARDAGLAHRPVADTIRDTLAWERELGLERVRTAGITPEREAELLAEAGDGS